VQDFFRALISFMRFMKGYYLAFSASIYALIFLVQRGGFAGRQSLLNSASAGSIDP
jgi:hypothetical protein